MRATSISRTRAPGCTSHNLGSILQRWVLQNDDVVLGVYTSSRRGSPPIFPSLPLPPTPSPLPLTHSVHIVSSNRNVRDEGHGGQPGLRLSTLFSKTNPQPSAPSTRGLRLISRNVRTATNPLIPRNKDQRAGCRVGGVSLRRVFGKRNIPVTRPSTKESSILVVARTLVSYFIEHAAKPRSGRSFARIKVRARDRGGLGLGRVDALL